MICVEKKKQKIEFSISLVWMNGEVVGVLVTAPGKLIWHLTEDQNRLRKNKLSIFILNFSMLSLQLINSLAISRFIYCVLKWQTFSNTNFVFNFSFWQVDKKKIVSTSSQLKKLIKYNLMISFENFWGIFCWFICIDRFVDLTTRCTLYTL